MCLSEASFKTELLTLPSFSMPFILDTVSSRAGSATSRFSTVDQRKYTRKEYIIFDRPSFEKQIAFVQTKHHMCSSPPNAVGTGVSLIRVVCKMKLGD